MPSTHEHISFTSLLLRRCSSIASLKEARQLHALLLASTPLNHQSPFLHHHVLTMYASCGSLADARLVFDKMPQRNIVSYNSLIAAYARVPAYASSAFGVLARMRYDDMFKPNGSTFTSLLRSVSCLGDWFMGLAIHCQIVKFGLFCDAWVQTALLGLYSISGDIDSAEGIFRSIDLKDAMAWNCVISGKLKNNRMREGLSLFIEMLNVGEIPTEFTYSMVFSACARLGDHAWGRLVHGWVVVTGAPMDLPMHNSLLDMYSSCGDTRSALSVFKRIERPDLVSWNSMLSGYAESGDGEQAFQLFILLLRMSTAKPDEYTFAALIDAVGELPSAQYGEPLHAQAFKFGCDQSVFVGSPLIYMYFRNQRTEQAERVFYSISKKDLVLWTEMIAGYSKMGDCENAVKLFFKLCQEGRRYDSFALSVTLSACADLATLQQGQMIHCQAIKAGCSKEMAVCGSLIDMYAKNGDLHAAESVFSAVPNPDIKCWNSMIGGCSHHGKAGMALDLFDGLVSCGKEADQVTFISLISACSHRGLVSKGKYLWKYMRENEIAAGPKHYSCMVSLLCRAGLLEESEELIKESPFSDDCVELWRTVLSSSVASKNLAVGVRAAEQILKFNPEDSGSHMLLSNLYAATGRWDQVMEIRKRIRGMMLEKEPGLSWIEVGKGVHVFASGNQSHLKTGSDSQAVLHGLEADMVTRPDLDDQYDAKMASNIG